MQTDKYLGCTYVQFYFFFDRTNMHRKAKERKHKSTRIASKLFEFAINGDFGYTVILGSTDFL